MKNTIKRLSAVIFCTILCGITVFAAPIIDAPFNAFDPVDELPEVTAVIAPTTQPTTEVITTTAEPEPTTAEDIPTTIAKVVLPINLR